MTAPSLFADVFVAWPWDGRFFWEGLLRRGVRDCNLALMGHNFRAAGLFAVVVLSILACEPAPGVPSSGGGTGGGFAGTGGSSGSAGSGSAGVGGSAGSGGAGGTGGTLVDLPPIVKSTPIGFANIPNRVAPYEYGPSIILENGTYYMFYCSPSDTPPYPYDAVRMVTSTDGRNWSSPSVALAANGSYAHSSVCDPSVVKFRGVYLMYYTCINDQRYASTPDGYDTNRVCVATADSVTGPYRPLDKPVVEDLNCQGAYCAGQPAALVYDDKVYLYYTDAYPEDSGPGVIGPGKIFLRTSADGISFGGVLNDGNPIWGRRNVDVKYDRASETFFLVQAEIDTRDLLWAYSKDGVKFTPVDLARTVAGPPDLVADYGRVHNPGITSLGDGSFGGQTSVFYQATIPNAQNNPIPGHLYRTDIVLNPASNDCSTCEALSCDRICQVTFGGDRIGICAAPGSTDPGSCCGCVAKPQPADCNACTSVGCSNACIGAGFDAGICGAPGSTNPNSCCGCYE
ncbi:MAG: hypothetical protein R3A47_05590 [Polyangiales bacterium]